VAAIVGPTASGKTTLALEVAAELNAEIISVDSMQVYRGMDIGTAKPTEDERASVPHHMIDIVEPDVSLTVAEFQERARAAVADVSGGGRLPLLVGGSGLYFRAVVDPLRFPGTDPEVRRRLEARAEDEGAEAMYRRLEELDPGAAAHIERQNARRIVRALEVIEITGRRFSDDREAWEEHESIYDLTVVGLDIAREELDRRIDVRVDDMISAGLIEEVKALETAGFRGSLTSPQALGYSQILAYLDGELSQQEAVAEIKRRTRRFARRQVSWFKSDPRVEWFPDPPQEAAARLRARLGRLV
jgi:tRNA dimethylallyltransferase